MGFSFVCCSRLLSSSMACVTIKAVCRSPRPPPWAVFGLYFPGEMMKRTPLSPFFLAGDGQSLGCVPPSVASDIMSTSQPLWYARGGECWVGFVVCCRRRTKKEEDAVDIWNELKRWGQVFEGQTQAVVAS